MKKQIFNLVMVILLFTILVSLTGCSNKEQIQKNVTNINIEKNAEITGVKAGEYILQYGTYKSDIKDGEQLGGTYELKPDGTFVYKNTWTSIQTGEKIVDDATGTYEIFYSEDKDLSTWIIKFNNETGGDELGFSAFDIVGDNKFSARQYQNIFTLQK